MFTKGDQLFVLDTKDGIVYEYGTWAFKGTDEHKGFYPLRYVTSKGQSILPLGDPIPY